MQQTAGPKFQMQCPRCGQAMMVSVSSIGKQGTCPACKHLFVPGHTPREAARFEESRAKKLAKTLVEQVQTFVCAVSGLRPLEGFHLTYLSANPLKHRSPQEINTYFNAGSPQTTPPLVAVSTEWPRPWFFGRLLIFGAAVLLAFIVGFQVFGNPNLLPGVIIVGAFCVPLACVSLFFEMNVLRNISLYQVLKFIVGGGTISIIIALTLYQVTHLEETFLGATSAGIIEEIAKAAAAVLLLLRLPQSKWILNGLLVGAAVGAGFAGFESAGYLFNAFLKDLIHRDPTTYEYIITFLRRGVLTPFYGFYGTLFLRAIFAPFCHVVWTAAVVGGLWRVKQDQPFHMKMLIHPNFLRVLIFVVLLHMLWNSGLLWGGFGIMLIKVQGYLWVTSFVGSWYLALLLFQEGLLQVRREQTRRRDG
jgi:RsiW-degrading membrane proteinase PrsW (M82 family)